MAHLHMYIFFNYRGENNLFKWMSLYPDEITTLEFKSHNKSNGTVESFQYGSELRHFVRFFKYVQWNFSKPDPKKTGPPGISANF
jgi:hypothetical protein